MAKKKKKYQKPKVIHREKAEVLAAVCDSAWVPGQTCITVVAECEKAG